MNIDAASSKQQPVQQSIGHQSEEFNFREMYGLLLAGRWTLIAITLLAFLSGAIYLLLATPTYEADGTVQVETDSKSGAAGQLSDLSSLFMGTPVQTEAEIQILQSRMILDQVIDKMNLLVSVKPLRFPLIGGLIARRHQDDPSPLAVPGWARRFSWGGEIIKVSSFDIPAKLEGQPFEILTTESGFDLLLPDGKKILSGQAGQLESVDLPSGKVSVFIRQLVAKPGTVFELRRNSRASVQNSLSLSLKVVELGKQSGVVKVSFDGTNPDFVTQVINDIENAYIRQNIERHSADAQQSLEFLEKQLPELKDKLDSAQTQLKAYQLAHGSIDITQETQIALSQSVDLQSQMLALQQQRDQMVQRFTPQHPAIKALDRQIEQLDAALGKLKGQSDKLPTTQQEILGLLRDVDVNSELYTAMLNTIQQLQVAKAGTIGNVRVVDSAITPSKPIKPKPALILILSLFTGIGLGIFVVILQRALIRGVDDPAEIERRFGLPTYAMVPYTKSQRSLHRTMRGGKDANYILASLESGNVAIESLRSLRTSLHFALFESKNNVVMLTGPAPGLGKSFISVNLSAVLAFSGKKVLLIDVDLRKGHLHHYISANDTPGVADYIADKLPLTDIIHKTAVPGLDLITRGTIPPNPSELLLHERFSNLLQETSKTYDYVLVDTPPVLAVTDAAIVSKLAGCTLLVLKSASHPMPQIEETIKRLVTAGASIKGTVFNLVGEKAGSYGYGGYGYAYYNYDSENS